FISLLTLRFTDHETPRTFRMPWNVTVRRNGVPSDIPIVGVLGLLGILSVLVATVLTHPIGRIAGPVWIGLGLVAYFLYRRKRRLPFPGSAPRDWPSQQLAAYMESGETEIAEEYRRALRTARAKIGAAPP
ncbi:MAG: hypothetical protein M3Z66_12690, partial [Chloroflexota bacterium]|nr:hypothetical protein [Chloroflexota bacterium]